MYYILENMKRNKTDLCLHRQLILANIQCQVRGEWIIWKCGLEYRSVGKIIALLSRSL